MTVESINDVNLRKLRKSLGFNETENIICYVKKDFVSENRRGKKFIVYKNAIVIINGFSTFGNLTFQVFDETTMKFGEELSIRESKIDYSIFERALQFDEVYEEYMCVLREYEKSNKKIEGKIYTIPAIICGLSLSIAFCVASIITTGLSLYLLFSFLWLISGFILTDAIIVGLFQDFIDCKLNEKYNNFKCGLIDYYYNKIKSLV